MPLRLACDWLVYVVVRLTICVIQSLRLETCQRLARVGGYLAADVLKLRHRVVDENIRHAFPDLFPAQRMQLARAMWEHLVLLACEIAHVPRKVHETNWRNYMRLDGISGKVKSLLSPRPCVVISGHFGNFEAGAYMIGLFGFRTYSIARPMDNPFLDKWITEFRQSKGQVMLPKLGVAAQIALLLEQGKNVALLGDQSAGPSGCWVDFFGRPASYHKAIALFSMSGRAPLVVSYARRWGGPLQMELGVAGVYDPNDPAQPGGVREVTQWYNDLLEDIVRRAPEQYWWVHRRWKDTRSLVEKRRDDRRRRRQQRAA